jgi:hypothetical protein
MAGDARARGKAGIAIVSTQPTTPRSLAPALSAATGLSLWLPSWPWLLGLAALVRALVEPAALLHDPDTYLHIAAGRWMFAHHALPVADLWSHTMTGAVWVPAEWLGEIVLAFIWGATGWGGIVILTAASFALAIALLAAFLLRRLPPLPAAIATLAGAVLVLPHLLARPHVLALPVLVAWCGALVAARDDERGPPWAILPVMALWANLHGSFMFGLALAEFFAAEAVLYPAAGHSRLVEAKRWGLFVMASIAMSLCNANGVSALLQPLRLVAMSALQSGFVEWAPANLGEFPALEIWLLAAVALGFALRVRLPWTRLVLLLGLFHMTLAHARHADLLGLVGPLTIAASLAPALAKLLEPAASSSLSRAVAVLARPARLPACALVLAFGLAASLPVLLHPPERAGDTVTPQAALAAARAQNLTGPVFNSEAYGGYLIFSGVPVSIDGRIEMYGNDFLAAYIAAEDGDAASLGPLLGRYHIAWTLLQVRSSAVGALDRMPGWRRAYSDGQAVIHVRED